MPYSLAVFPNRRARRGRQWVRSGHRFPVVVHRSAASPSRWTECGYRYASRGESRWLSVDRYAGWEERCGRGGHRSPRPGEPCTESRDHSPKAGEWIRFAMYLSPGRGERWTATLQTCAPAAHHFPGPAEWCKTFENLSSGRGEEYTTEQERFPGTGEEYTTKRDRSPGPGEECRTKRSRSPGRRDWYGRLAAADAPASGGCASAKGSAVQETRAPGDVE